MSPIRWSTIKKLLHLCSQKFQWKTQRDAQEEIRRFVQRGQSPCTLIEYKCWATGKMHWHIGHFNTRSQRQTPAMISNLDQNEPLTKRLICETIPSGGNK